MSNTTFSILTPVYDPPQWAFLECAASVFAQNYPDWEWCIVNDASSAPWVRTTLDQMAAEDPRVMVRHREQNGGISEASNDGLAMTTGQFVVLLDHDDLLTHDALGTINHRIWLDEEIDYIYSDEDKVAENGTFFGEFMKPAWSPERLLCQNYCCHVSAIRRELLVEVGGFRSLFDGAQDYDLILRVTERARKVAHIPEVLYHWRIIEGSTAGSLEAKPHAIVAGRRAVTDALARREIDGEVVDVGHGYHRVHRQLTAHPAVSIVVPTRGTIGQIWGLDMPYVVNMIDSVRQLSTYPNIEFVVVYSASMTNDQLAEIEQVAGEVKLVKYDEPFNFSKKCNLGALEASGDILIFMNDDMEVRSEDWIETLIAFLEDPTVGMVGPMLLFDNFLVQSAGHSSAPPSHFARGRPPSASGAAAWALALNREVMGITGACMAIRRDLFFRIGGFSLEFPVNFNDVDLGFKVIESSHRIIWTPAAEIFHFESKSRVTTVKEEEVGLLYKLWGRYMQFDPYLPETSPSRQNPSGQDRPQSRDDPVRTIR